MSVLPLFQNDWWIVDARFIMRWSTIVTFTTGTDYLAKECVVGIHQSFRNGGSIN